MHVGHGQFLFFVPFCTLETVLPLVPGEGGTPYSGLYGETPPERGTFFTLQAYKRVGISQVEVYKRVGKSVIWVFEKTFNYNNFEEAPFMTVFITRAPQGVRVIKCNRFPRQKGGHGPRRSMRGPWKLETRPRSL